MSNVITVDNLGKKYFLQHQAKRESYVALRDLIADFCYSFSKRALAPFSSRSPASCRSRHSNLEEFWALNQLSFEVKQGARIGIIGRNGAGKSTLLKILSRITEPTTGSVRIKGKVASLLEVGTGFHPELTGRENIFLNGAILGMKRSEIIKKFDEIVDFAEIDRFLDTPVKRYSSGMYVRLAFAVAAHLDPEILIVDEVLAVGDAQFQQKCLGKMEDVSRKDGRTVLFVSHNMTSISNICKEVIVLQNGRIEFNGEAQNGIDCYIKNHVSSSTLDYGDRRLHDGELLFSWFCGVRILSLDGNPSSELRIGEGLKVLLDFELSENVSTLEIGFCIHNQMGQRYSHFFAEWEGFPTTFVSGRHHLECAIPELYLLPGTYEISPWIKRKGGPQDDCIHSAEKFTVIGADVNGHQPDFERYPNLGIYIRSNWTGRTL